MAEIPDNRLDNPENKEASRMPNEADTAKRIKVLQGIRGSSSNGEIKNVAGKVGAEAIPSTRVENGVIRLNGLKNFSTNTSHQVERRDNEGNATSVNAINVKRESPKDAIANGSHPAEAQQAAAEKNTPLTTNTTTSPEIPTRIPVSGGTQRIESSTNATLGTPPPVPTQQEIARGNPAAPFAHLNANNPTGLKRVK